MEDPIEYDAHIPMPPMVMISTQTLYHMHLANSRRLGALEHTAKENAGVLSELKVSNARIETKLDLAIKCDDKIGCVADDLKEVAADLNKAKGAGILMDLLLAIAGTGAAIWAVVHGKG